MMNEQTITSDPGRVAELMNRPVTLRGKWLLFGRAMWIVLALAIFVVTVTLVTRYRGLLLIGDDISRSFNALPQFMSYATFSRLVQWGRYAVLAVYNLTALLIFWRKS